ncbi:hypothetical protein H4219_005453 [Mycoemilia scoparia]|uniref:AAA-ATPase-like domain-containing protein n=1 Tax=Mycoemilia scoparia TaxID=417184 RepID=A0A9W7ZW31_9FUNG|nr:hypothetical protein H4219_005453 [Mycoemilia scoparia]
MALQAKRSDKLFYLNSTSNELDRHSHFESPYSVEDEMDLLKKYRASPYDTPAQANVFGSRIDCENVDWVNAKREGCALVDKTRHLKLLFDENLVELVFRQHQSGKTIFYLMASHFFGLTENEDELLKKQQDFKDSLLAQDESGPAFIEEHCGQYPTMSISFQDVEPITKEEFIYTLSDKMITLYMQWSDVIADYENSRNVHMAKEAHALLPASHHEFRGNLGCCTRLLANLSKYLCGYYGRKCVILIDAVDTPILSTTDDTLLEYVYKVIRDILDPVLDSHYIRKCIVFGVENLDLCSTLSSNANDAYYSIDFAMGNEYTSDSNIKFMDAFGFTESEVRKLIGLVIPNDTDLNKKGMNLATGWYNGYFVYNNLKTYNPSSVLCFIESIRIYLDPIKSGKMPIENLAVRYWDQAGRYSLKSLFEKANHINHNAIVKLIKDYIIFKESSNGNYENMMSVTFDSPYSKQMNNHGSSHTTDLEDMNTMNKLYNSGWDGSFKPLDEPNHIHIQSSFDPINHDDSYCSSETIFFTRAYFNGYLTILPGKKIGIPNREVFTTWVRLLGTDIMTDRHYHMLSLYSALVSQNYMRFVLGIKDLILLGLLDIGSNENDYCYELVSTFLKTADLGNRYDIKANENATGLGNNKGNIIMMRPRYSGYPGFVIKVTQVKPEAEESKVKSAIQATNIQDSSSGDDMDEEIETTASDLDQNCPDGFTTNDTATVEVEEHFLSGSSSNVKGKEDIVTNKVVHTTLTFKGKNFQMAVKRFNRVGQKYVLSDDQPKLKTIRLDMSGEIPYFSLNEDTLVAAHQPRASGTGNKRKADYIEEDESEHNANWGIDSSLVAI